LDIFKEPNQVRHTDRTIKMALLLFSVTVGLLKAPVAVS
jgi:hypothetical protein